MLHKKNPIVILGAGKMAKFLSACFKGSDFQLVQVYARNKQKAISSLSLPPEGFIDKLTKIRTDASIYILAVSDDAILELSKRMPKVKGLVVHTSGARALKSIDEKHKRRGVFYPLQSFAGQALPEKNDVPLLLEAEEEGDYPLLERAGTLVSGQILRVDSQQRLRIHLAAVLVNNFTNHLYELAEDMLKDIAVDDKILHPLMERTLQLAMSTDKGKRRTGPAARGDENTIEKHLELIRNDEKLLELYTLLTASIKDSVGKK